MKKFNYDLGHYSFQVGRVGCLMTLSTIPIVAGDRIQLDGTGIFRLSPLRRNLTVDAKVDLFAFYIPYRHVYGDDWLTFMKEGIDETTTFGGIDVGSVDYASAYGGPYKGTRAKWLVVGYNQIWNRYFRHPTDGVNEVSPITTVLPTVDQKKYGKNCAHLPSIWNTGIDGEIDSSDLQVSTAGDVLDLTELAKQKARLRTERRREFYSQRYNDVLARTYGTRVNIDADERPELVMRSSMWMSGYDVDGTGDATLGQYSGKSAAIGRIQIPRKRFNEHGTLWLMALMRFPPIHEGEVHYLSKLADPSYIEISGDPDHIANEPPITIDVNKYMGADTGHVADAGNAPYGQWYRYHPNHVHNDYIALQGFTFLNEFLDTKDKARYVQKSDYDDVFQNTQLAHWQSYMRMECLVDRVVPPVESSIFAGSR